MKMVSSAGITHDIGDFVGGEHRVQWNDHRTQLEDPVIDGDPLPANSGESTAMVPPLTAFFAKRTTPPCIPVDLVQLGEGSVTPIGYEGCSVPTTFGESRQKLTETVERRQVDVRRRSTAAGRGSRRRSENDSGAIAVVCDDEAGRPSPRRPRRGRVEVISGSSPSARRRGRGTLSMSREPCEFNIPVQETGLHHLKCATEARMTGSTVAVWTTSIRGSRWDLSSDA